VTRPKLPPPEDEPRNVRMVALDIASAEIVEWHPLPDGQGRPTQVWLIVTFHGAPLPAVWRFKGPDTLGQIIAALQRHRANVWPDAPEWVP
jgi:hypothetical protein